MGLMTSECARLHGEEATAPKRIKGSDAGPSANPSPAKRSTVAHRVQPKVPAGRGARGIALSADSDDELEGLFVSGDDVPVVPSPEMGRPATQEMLTIKIKYGKETSPSLPRESTAPAPPAPNSGSKASAGSGFARSHGEIVELSGEAPRLKSRLSSPPS
ncbi:hypothetical protein TorRG33x02_264630, partial [Trema orientale]